MTKGPDLLLEMSNKFYTQNGSDMGGGCDFRILEDECVFNKQKTRFWSILILNGVVE